MDIAVLVRMANDIAHFFDAYPDKDQAATAIAAHLKNFWDPAMRGQLIDHAAQGGEGLEGPIKKAMTLLSHENSRR